MRCRSRWVVAVVAMVWFAGTSVASGQNGRSWRDYVRQHGDTNILVDLCGPITGLKEIVEVTQLTVEGTIAAAEGKLTAKEDEVYTESGGVRWRVICRWRAGESVEEAIEEATTVWKRVSKEKKEWPVLR